MILKGTIKTPAFFNFYNICYSLIGLTDLVAYFMI